MYTFDEIAAWTSSVWKNLDPDVPEAGTGKGAVLNLFPNLGKKREAEPRSRLMPGLSHDTRTLKAGEVYMAIRGDNHDGHDFVGQAVEAGAAGMIVEREFPGLGHTPQLIVPDTRAALWQIAAGVRSVWSGTVIGITGSAGKTTVKEMVAAVLARKGRVSKTLLNWNNEIGLPLSMIAAARDSDYFVFELGMNHPGEITLLAGLLRPDWALITNIGKAHIGFFECLERIADEKASILKHAQHALLDADSEWFEQLHRQFAGKVRTLTREPFRVSQPGAHMIQNARFAATIGLELGLSHDEIQQGLDSFENAPMRWKTIEKDGVLFINDAYNANPLSMRAAVSTFAEMPCAGRRFIVLGGMRELGDREEEEHRALGEFVEGFSFDRVITIGPLGALIECRGLLGVEKEKAADILCEELRAGDMVLLKASRGEKLETIFDQMTT